MTCELTEDKWENLYRHGLGAPKYPNGNVVRWLFGNFPRQRAADFHLLDMGCGMGRHGVMMAREGYRVSATDYSRAAIDQAGRWADSANLKINFSQAPAENQPFADQSFDGILSYGVLYYLSPDKMRQAFNEIHRLLKIGGKSLVMIKNNRDVRASKGREIAPDQFIITHRDEAMPWNNEQDMRLTLLSREKLLELCADFAEIVINCYQ